jgi:hypothetical protein
MAETFTLRFLRTHTFAVVDVLIEGFALFRSF